MLNKFKETLRNNKEFVEYCNKEISNNTNKIKDDLYWAIKDLFNKSVINPKVSVLKFKNTLTIKIELKSKMLSVNYTLKQDGFEQEMERLTSLFETIINGVDAVDRLNKLIFNKQQNGTDLFIKFKVGIDSYCKIGNDWNFDLMIIQLSQKAVDNLIQMGDKLEKYLEPYIDEGLDTSIVKLIQNFNNISLCNRIDARLQTNDVQEELLREVICEPDVEKLINDSQCRASGECYQITYFSIMDGLGTYIMQVKCDIDFKEKDVHTKVIDKIYDLENDEFVTSEGLIEKIKMKKESKGKEWSSTLNKI